MTAPWELEAELADTLEDERLHRRKRRRCWLKGCDGYGHERVRSLTARGTYGTRWYCDAHAPWVHEHNRVIQRILGMPVR